MTVTTPIALVLLLSIPLILYIGWPRQRFRRTRDIVSLILRITIVTLVILALAGVQVAQSANKLAVIFLVDTSDSVGTTGTESAIEIVREALSTMDPDDQAGVVLFGADAQVERAVNNVRELGPVRAVTATGNTDIAGAIRLALALFPGDTARRIVVFSDGIATLGDTEAAAQLAAASGVEISYVPTNRETGSEVRVTRLDAPSAVPAGQQFDLSMTVVSDEDINARIDIFASGELIASQETVLRSGTNNRTLTLEASDAGFQDFSVVVEPEGADSFYQNNSLATFSQVVGPARVLLVGQSAEDTQYLTPALEEAGLTVDVITPSDLPFNAVPLAQYDSIIMANVPATQLTTRRMQALQTYVRDLGGGLVAVGGPETYGPGGYFETPLEETLPVDMQLKDQQRVPQLTIAYVIDRSGSMGSVGPDGVPQIELAKAAINRSIDFLQPTDRAAVATFDAVAYWIAEFQDVNDRRVLQQLVGTLRPSGGTDVLSGMRLVAEDIINEPSQIKHIILLTDGLTNPQGLVELTRQLQIEQDVTTTTIAIGSASTLLQQMAQVGGGNYHIASDISTIPSLFAQETVLATRSYIFEQETFTPTLTANNPIMQGIDALPQLRGYIGTSPKTAAQVVLRGPEPYRDPVLAAWQYGLGRSVAFTSDATARWASDWVTWDEFSRFWNQVVRWTITEGGNETIETRVVMEDNQARVIVDARSADGEFLNGMEMLASIVDPEFGNQRITLRQVAPGRYEAMFNPQSEGAYLLRISGTSESGGDEAVSVNQTTGWVMSYSPEYLTVSTEESILPTVAEITGGQSFEEDISLAFNRNLEARNASQPVWPLLLLAAMLLLPIDIAVRRLIITRSDWQRLGAYLSRRREPSQPEPTERMSTLLDARERARQRSQTEQAPTATIGALKSRRAARSESTPAAAPDTASAARDAKPAKKAPPAEKPSTPSKPQSGQSEGSIGAKLLNRKRERQRDDED